MENKLRRNFVLYSMLMFFIVISLLTFSVNVIVREANNRFFTGTINNILENNGVLHLKNPNIQNESFFRRPNVNDYFVVVLEGDKIVSTNNVNDNIDIKDYTNYALKEKNGVFNNYRFKLKEENGSTMIVFVNELMRTYIVNTTLLMSILGSFLTMLIVYIVLMIISKRVVKPFIENNNKQKEFITNVTHEFKTPITIIKTNTEVIELSNGETEFTKSIHKNVDKLNILISNLINFNKFEELEKVEFSKIDVTEYLKDRIEEFSLMLPNLEFYIEDDIVINFNLEMFESLILILFDNMIKYGDSNKKSFIKLFKENKKNIMIFSNFSDDLEIKNYSELFDRFYRLDKSRKSKDSSFGIGLSHVKRICELNNSEIESYSNDGETIVFKVLFK